jgi:hypothetical protein
MIKEIIPEPGASVPCYYFFSATKAPGHKHTKSAGKISIIKVTKGISNSCLTFDKR